MRPWFLKEGEVVPFAKKEKTVVSMPNVASYPNFLAGVEDLQSRVKQGTLSDEMYKRLYTDLLHRFMRRESAETPWFIREDKTTDADIAIKQLTKIADKEPQKSTAISNAMQKVLDFTRKVLGQKDSTVENVNMAIPMEIEANLDKMMRFGKDNEVEKAKEFLIKLANQFIIKGQEKERGNIKDFQSTVDKIVSDLAIKLNQSLLTLAKSQSEVVEKDKLRQLNSMKGKLETSIRGVFSKLTSTGMTDELKRKQITDFMKKLIVGIVPFNTIINSKGGNIDNIVKLVAPNDYDIYQKIKSTLMATVPDVGKGTNWGPGEFGLALIAKPGTKGGKGDLADSQGNTVELKSSANANKGARLGVENSIRTNQSRDWETKLKEYFGPNTTYKFTRLKTKKSSKEKDEIIHGKRDLTKRGIDSAGGINTLISNVKNFKTMSFLKDAIALTLSGDKKQNMNILTQNEKYLIPAINKDGTINFENWLKGLTQILYQFYGGTAGKKVFRKIMVMNPNSTNYKIIDSVDSLGDAIEQGNKKQPGGIIASGGLDFSLDKYPKTPQLGIN